MATSDELNAQLQEIALEIIEATIDRAAPRIRRLQRRQKVLRDQLKVVAHKEKRDHAEQFRFRISELSILAAAVIAALGAVSDAPVTAACFFWSSAIVFLLIFPASIMLGYLTQTSIERVAELGIPEFGRCDFVLVVALVVAGLLAILGTVFMQVPVP